MSWEPYWQSEQKAPKTRRTILPIEHFNGILPTGTRDEEFLRLEEVFVSWITTGLLENPHEEIGWAGRCVRLDISSTFYT